MHRPAKLTRLFAACVAVTLTGTFANAEDFDLRGLRVQFALGNRSDSHHRSRPSVRLIGDRAQTVRFGLGDRFDEHRRSRPSVRLGHEHTQTVRFAQGHRFGNHHGTCPSARLGYDYGQTVRFGGRSHLDALSADLKYRANAICWEMYRNYRTNPGFQITYSEAYEMLQQTKHIYMLVWENEYHLRSRGQEDHIAADLAQIDALFHHIEDDIATWRPDYFHPHHGGNLHRLVEEMEQTLHHLMEDYGVTSQIPVGGEPPLPDGFGNPPVPSL